jgi:hypothetical protein
MSIVDFPSQGTIGTNLQPKRYDIVLYQGDDFQFNFVLKDSLGAALDLTGWSGLAQIKNKATGSAAETPALTVTVGTTNGTVNVSISSTGTDALQGDTEYKYDVQLTDAGGKKRTYIGGVITVTEDVSE